MSDRSAIYKRPPGPSDANGAAPKAGNRVFAAAIPITTGAAKAVCTTLTVGDPAAIPDQGCFITWIMSVDTYFITGSASDATVADANCVLIPAGSERDWWHTKDDTHFSLMAVGGVAGTVKRWKSNR